MLAIEGDKSACSDEAIREKISGFPPEIKDHELLTKIKGHFSPSPLFPPLVLPECTLLQTRQQLMNWR